MIKDVLQPHPLLKSLGPAPFDQSPYAFLMAKLPPVERIKVIREAIEKAEDPGMKRLRINWAHLLLAPLVDAGYINQILTTNFDPLIVEALSLTAQPIRVFDLTASVGFQAGALQPGSVVYLHGQAHGLWLSNSSEELDRVRRHLNSVFQDALRDSIIIVVGYSGTCDPVLLELIERFPQFRHRLYWVHNDAASNPGNDAMKLLTDHYREAYLVKGLDADAFMRALVLEGLKLELPLIVKNPLDSLIRNLDRVMPFPQKPQDPSTDDPVRDARKLVPPTDDPVRNARKLVLDARGCISGPGEGGEVAVTASELATLDSLLPIAVSMAAAAKDRPKLELLRERIERKGDGRLRAELGQAYLSLASDAITKGDFDQAFNDLKYADKMGTRERHWFIVVWGNALSEQAKTRSGPEADALFQQAYEKYAEALQIKPDMHAALSNWGVALTDQAKTKSGLEADVLFSQACDKYSDALRIEPDNGDVLYNWGTALSHQATTRSGPEADALFRQAYEKYAEALRIKPDGHDVLSNWGNALMVQAKNKNGPAANTLFQQAYEKYAEALRIKPDHGDTLYNWGAALTEQAKTKSGPEADVLFRQACEKYSSALRIKPDKDEVLSNWAAVLSIQAKSKGGLEADAMFQQAYEKYTETMRIKPDKHDSLSYWGAALMAQAMTKSGPGVDALFRQAYEKYAEALRIKPDYRPAHFNMACLFALRGETETSLCWLRTWIEGNHDATKVEIESEHDFDGIREDPSFQEFLASLG